MMQHQSRLTLADILTTFERLAMERVGLPVYILRLSRMYFYKTMAAIVLVRFDTDSDLRRVPTNL